MLKSLWYNNFEELFFLFFCFTFSMLLSLTSQICSIVGYWWVTLSECDQLSVQLINFLSYYRRSSRVHEWSISLRNIAREFTPCSFLQCSLNVAFQVIYLISSNEHNENIIRINENGMRNFYRTSNELTVNVALLQLTNSASQKILFSFVSKFQ